jgi:hypothetical protein
MSGVERAQRNAPTSYDLQLRRLQELIENHLNVI